MLIRQDQANESLEHGILSLSQSLLNSRLTWLTTAFVPLLPEHLQLSRQLITEVELQIGPHIFANTRFYQLHPLDDSHRPMVAFEFSKDNPNTLFSLPKDLGIEEHSPQRIVAYFYANNPSQKATKDPTRPQRTLARIQLVIRNHSNQLLDTLTQWTEDPTVKVWRDYRRALCQPKPQVKYYSMFFPSPYQRQMNMNLEPEIVVTRRATPRRRLRLKTTIPKSSGGKSQHTIQMLLRAAQARCPNQSDSDNDSVVVVVDNLNVLENHKQQD